jgi:tRNA threonylcarbamoyladenosine biosynthesis protein TsaE
VTTAVSEAPLNIVSRSEEETRTLGATIGHLLQPGDVVLLHGDLGSGKTTLTQGIAKGLGIDDYVQSPTFTLVAEHSGHGGDGHKLYHLDLYRLTNPDELESFGYEDLVTQSDGVVVVEWPERAGDILPDEYLLVIIDPMGPGERLLTIQSAPFHGPERRIVEGLRASSRNNQSDGDDSLAR